MYFNVFRIKSHVVSVNALHSVVSITANAVIAPLCPKFFAITKQLPGVALPSITKMAISFSPRNPKYIAAGRKIPQNNSNLIKTIPAVTAALPFVSLTLNDAPSAISDSGVAIFPRYDIDFAIMTGCEIPDSDHRIPASIPNMIGFVTIPFTVLTASSLPLLPLSFPGDVKDRTITAIIL